MLKLDELLGSLKIYEVELDAKDKPKRDKTIALKARQKNHKTQRRRKSSKALKIEESKNDDSIQSEQESSDEDDELSFISRKIRRMWIKKSRANQTFKKNVKDEAKPEKSFVICCECNQPGHYKSECPTLKKKPKKSREGKKSMMAMTLSRKLQNEKGMSIASIRSNHGGEFENEKFRLFCEENGIFHNFSASRTPQQNGVVERKNRTIQEMARTMLCEMNLPKYFWAEAVNIACYIHNRILLRPMLKKTPYELWNGRRPNISYFHPFRCKCSILNTKELLDKFDSKTYPGIFLGYSSSSKAFRVYNLISKTVEETIHVKFDDSS
ncbi:hypothetical protein K2173_023218 [Erythroxylum novogranatense]|uniref:Retrovirus-related Pol polyprotein from transposon TNT 1-94 n=1 Tax=Erythroxylum novogranatense TaxID=1862640 RepID=A0AAV8TA12_9ROSI|nr:hypothetical protein K2173_023218 [Erythroxylum novogranatense]